MYIRNHYELSDENKVPSLIHEYKEMVLKEVLEDDEYVDEEKRGFYEFIHFMSWDDDISSYISKEIWKKVREE